MAAAYITQNQTANGASSSSVNVGLDYENRAVTVYAFGIWDGARANVQATWNPSASSSDWFDIGQGFTANGIVNLSIGCFALRANVVGANATTNVSLVVV